MIILIVLRTLRSSHKGKITFGVGLLVLGPGSHPGSDEAISSFGASHSLTHVRHLPDEALHSLGVAGEAKHLERSLSKLFDLGDREMARQARLG